MNKLRTQMQNTNTLKKEEKYFYLNNVCNFYKNTKVRKCWLVPRAKMNFFNTGSGLLFGWLKARNKYKEAFNNPVCKKIFDTKKQKWRESNLQTNIEENAWKVAAKCQIVVEKRKISGCRRLGFRTIEKVSRVDSLSAQAARS